MAHVSRVWLWAVSVCCRYSRLPIVLIVYFPVFQLPRTRQTPPVVVLPFFFRSRFLISRCLSLAALTHFVVWHRADVARRMLLVHYATRMQAWARRRLAMRHFSKRIERARVGAELSLAGSHFIGSLRQQRALQFMVSSVFQCTKNGCYDPVMPWMITCSSIFIAVFLRVTGLVRASVC